MKKILLSILIVVSLTSVNASEDGGTESPFNFGFGAREHSLGGSNITHISAATAVFWNSSQLASAEHFELTSYYSQLFGSDVVYQYAGLAYPTINYGTFGFGISRLGVTGINKRDIHNFDLGEFDDTRLGIYLAFGKTMAKYDVGVMLNIEQHSIDQYKNSSSPGLNLSIGRTFTLNKSLFNNFKTVLRYSNLLKPSMKLSDETITYPSKLQLGLSTNILLPEKWNSALSLYSHISKVENLSTKFAFGIEYSIYEILSLRGGLRDDNSSVGVGINYKMINFDYALVNRDLGAVHMFSLTSAFGSSISAKRELRIKQEEQKFNQLMTSRLEEKNNLMIAELIKSGHKHLQNNELIKALSDFERSLFLIKSNNMDTTEIAGIIQNTSAEILVIENEIFYSQLLDSAELKFNEAYYLEAKYFAARALDVISNSVDAQQLLDSCEYYISNQLSEKELLTEQLLMADSLINYGNISKSIRILTELKNIAPDDKRVQRQFTKAQFENYRKKAENAMMVDAVELARSSLDSASALFPGHQWCDDFKNLLDDLTQKQITNETVPNISKPVVMLSENIKNEAAFLCRTAQEQFEDGDLQSAVRNWEMVENMAPDFQSTRMYLINAYKYLGVELYGNNKLYDAVKIWRKAEKLNPNNKEIANYIKRTLNEIEKVKELTYGESYE